MGNLLGGNDEVDLCQLEAVARYREAAKEWRATAAGGLSLDRAPARPAWREGNWIGHANDVIRRFRKREVPKDRFLGELREQLLGEIQAGRRVRLK